MTHQLVFQFSEPKAVAEYDRLIELEESMIKLLSSRADVDGHDSGLGEFNIFVHTDAPEELFVPIFQLIEAAMPGRLVAAGYRNFEEENYHPLWPRGSQHFSVS